MGSSMVPEWTISSARRHLRPTSSTASLMTWYEASRLSFLPFV